MKDLDLAASDEDILCAVRQWVDLLVQEQYQKAYDELYHMEPSQGNELTAENIEDNIRKYHQPGAVPGKVTPLETATGGLPPRHNVDRSPGAAEGFVWFDLPINGQWSDLTATFDVLRHGDALVLRLQDIHIM